MHELPRIISWLATFVLLYLFRSANANPQFNSIDSIYDVDDIYTRYTLSCGLNATVVFEGIHTVTKEPVNVYVSCGRPLYYYHMEVTGYIPLETAMVETGNCVLQGVPGADFDMQNTPDTDQSTPVRHRRAFLTSKSRGAINNELGKINNRAEVIKDMSKQLKEGADQIKNSIQETNTLLNQLNDETKSAFNDLQSFVSDTMKDMYAQTDMTMKATQTQLTNVINRMADRVNALVMNTQSQLEAQNWAQIQNSIKLTYTKMLNTTQDQMRAEYAYVEKLMSSVQDMINQDKEDYKSMENMYQTILELQYHQYGIGPITRNFHTAVKEVLARKYVLFLGGLGIAPKEDNSDPMILQIIPDTKNKYCGEKLFLISKDNKANWYFQSPNSTNPMSCDSIRVNNEDPALAKVVIEKTLFYRMNEAEDSSLSLRKNALLLQLKSVYGYEQRYWGTSFGIGVQTSRVYSQFQADIYSSKCDYARFGVYRDEWVPVYRLLYVGAYLNGAQALVIPQKEFQSYQESLASNALLSSFLNKERRQSKRDHHHPKDIKEEKDDLASENDDKDASLSPVVEALKRALQGEKSHFISAQPLMPAHAASGSPSPSSVTHEIPFMASSHRKQGMVGMKTTVTKHLQEKGSVSSNHLSSQQRPHHLDGKASRSSVGSQHAVHVDAKMTKSSGEPTQRLSRRNMMLSLMTNMDQSPFESLDKDIWRLLPPSGNAELDAALREKTEVIDASPNSHWTDMQQASLFKNDELLLFYRRKARFNETTAVEEYSGSMPAVEKLPASMAMSGNVWEVYAPPSSMLQMDGPTLTRIGKLGYFSAPGRPLNSTAFYEGFVARNGDFNPEGMAVSLSMYKQFTMDNSSFCADLDPSPVGLCRLSSSYEIDLDTDEQRLTLSPKDATSQVILDLPVRQPTMSFNTVCPSLKDIYMSCNNLFCKLTLGNKMDFNMRLQVNIKHNVSGCSETFTVNLPPASIFRGSDTDLTLHMCIGSFNVSVYTQMEDDSRGSLCFEAPGVIVQLPEVENLASVIALEVSNETQAIINNYEKLMDGLYVQEKIQNKVKLDYSQFFNGTSEMALLDLGFHFAEWQNVTTKISQLPSFDDSQLEGLFNLSLTFDSANLTFGNWSAIIDEQIENVTKAIEEARKVISTQGKWGIGLPGMEPFFYLNTYGLVVMLACLCIAFYLA